MGEKNNCVQQVAYGKIYLAGEYAILEDKSLAIISSVERAIEVKLKKSEKIKIIDTFYNEESFLEEQNKNLKRILDFIKYILDYLEEDKPFEITITNNLHENKKKYGLGSSSAVLVAICKGIFSFYNKKFSNYEIFKLVVVFCLKNGENGSFGDTASCVFFGTIFYKKFSKNKILSLIENNDLKKVIKTRWEDLEIKKINVKNNIEIVAKWTGEVVDTKEHIKKWKENFNEEEYSKFIKNSNNLVLEFYKLLEEENNYKIFDTINKIRNNLLFLEKISNIPMETKKMKNFINSFSAGKQSGSGSGDLVLGFRKSDKFKITLDLEKLD